MEMETATVKSETVTTNHEVKKSSDTSSMERREKIYVWLCGVLTLTPIILIIVVLFSLPTVFYLTVARESQTIVRIIIIRSFLTSQIGTGYFHCAFKLPLPNGTTLLLRFDEEMKRVINRS